MQRILSVKQMQDADFYTINTLGILSSELVERAGTAVSEVIEKRFKGGRVLVCIGKGNNGKDGEIIARNLSLIHGFSVNKFYVESGDFSIFDKKHDIIVDCIFGIGLNREVTGNYLTAIRKINKSGAFVVSCDIPSGLNGDMGKPMGEAVKANVTVAIQELKFGHFLNDGKDYSGETLVKDVGISVWEEDFCWLTESKDVKQFFPKRKINTNKGNYGKTAIVGGSLNFPGSVALSLSALASLKTGVGYTTLAVPDCTYNQYANLVPEATRLVLSSNGKSITFNEQEFSELLPKNAVAIGMGMCATEHTYNAIKYLLANYEGRLIIDADGLNALSKFGVEILKNKKCEVVLTPHVVEFCRLTNKTKEEVLLSPITLAKDFAKEYNVVLLLKNAVSIITDGQTTFLNDTGSPSMAKGGSGDVLSGVIAGMSARENDLIDCVRAGAYLFGRAGEIATKNANEYTVTATEIIACIKDAINEL